MDGASGETKWLIYLVGWQQTVAGKNIQSLNWLINSDSGLTVLQTGKFREDSQLLYDIFWFEEEK
jgi:hypothetical protein